MKQEREAFSRRLADAMREAGLEARPVVLAREFNLSYRGDPITFQSASRWLRGKSIPGQDKLQALARRLEIEPQVLRFGSAKATAVAEPAVRRFSGLRPQDREAIDAFLLLPAERRKLVRELIAALAT